MHSTSDPQATGAVTATGPLERRESHECGIHVTVGTEDLPTAPGGKAKPKHAIHTSQQNGAPDNGRNGEEISNYIPQHTLMYVLFTLNTSRDISQTHLITEACTPYDQQGPTSSQEPGGLSTVFVDSHSGCSTQTSLA